MAIQNEFTCPKGHKFTAVAKLRARCPECGQMARKQFNSQSQTVTKISSATQSTSSPSSHKVVTRTGTTSGSKSDTTLKSENPPKSVVRSTPKQEPSTKKPIVIKRGLTRQVPKMTRSPKQPIKTNTAKVARGPVKRVTAKRGIAPTVTKPPRGSRERKVIQQTSEEPFWVQAKRKYFG